jgi:spore coat polysaccharide biosynthesis predicted glycosyltransferase SpsG/RimJ/RimL family protein N-acetyltransferase
MKIGFRLDANRDIGFGHFFRSMAIAEVFADLGNDVYIFSRGLPSWLEKISESRNVSVIDLSGIQHGSCSHLNQGASKMFPQTEDSCSTFRTSESLGIELLVIDHYDVNENWLHAFSPGKILVAQIADFPALRAADYVLDYGFDASSEKHKSDDMPVGKLLLGPSFAPVPRIVEKHLDYPENLKREPQVFFALGSAVSLDFLRDLAFECAKIEGPMRFLISSGSQFPSWKKTPSVEIIDPVDGLGRFFSGSSFAVTSAGVSLYERMAHGVPGLVLETATNQQPSLTALRKIGLGSDVFAQKEGLSPKGLLDLVIENFEDALTSEQNLLLQSRVDFSGPSRVAFRLGLISQDRELEFRRASGQDSPTLLRWANDPLSRANSINSTIISTSQHLDWVKSFSARKTEIWMFEYASIPFGQVRFDTDPDSQRVFVSYSVDSLFRGMGRSKKMLSIAIRAASLERDIFAKAKDNNLASIKTLTALGFTAISNRDNLVTMVLRNSPDPQE